MPLSADRLHQELAADLAELIKAVPRLLAELQAAHVQLGQRPLSAKELSALRASAAALEAAADHTLGLAERLLEEAAPKHVGHAPYRQRAGVLSLRSGP